MLTIRGANGLECSKNADDSLQTFESLEFLNMESGVLEFPCVLTKSKIIEMKNSWRAIDS